MTQDTNIEASIEQVNAVLKDFVNNPHTIDGLLLPDPNATPESREVNRGGQARGASADYQAIQNQSLLLRMAATL